MIALPSYKKAYLGYLVFTEVLSSIISFTSSATHETALKKIVVHYMFGDDFLINPVYNYQVFNKELYLSQAGWYNFYIGNYLGGCKKSPQTYHQNRCHCLLRKAS